MSPAYPAWTIHREDEPSPEIRAGILAPLLAFNEESGGPARTQPLAITVRD